MKKDTILTLVIGILIGAIATAASFLIYEKSLADKVQDTNKNEANTEQNQMDEMDFFDGEMPPPMPDGEMPPH